MDVALIVALLSLFGTGLSAFLNYRSQQGNNDLQRTLANQANVWQRENRDYENWFNSPSGLQSRGLNPALAMSAAGGNLAMSADAGAANLPSDLKAPQVPDFGQSLAGATSSGVQLAQAQSQISLNQSQADLAEAEAAAKRSELPINEQKVINMKQDWENLVLQGEEIAAKIANLSQDTRKKIHEVTSIDETWRAYKKSIDSQTDLFKAETEKLGIDIKLSNRELWERNLTWQYRLKGFDLNNQKTQAELGFTQQQTNTEWWRTINESETSNILSTQNRGMLLDNVMKSFDVNARTIEDYNNRSDIDVYEYSPFMRYLMYGGHVFGKVTSPILGRSTFNYSFGQRLNTNQNTNNSNIKFKRVP